MASVPSHVAMNKRRANGINRIGFRRVKQHVPSDVRDIVAGTQERHDVDVPMDLADEEIRINVERNDQSLAKSTREKENMDIGTASITGIGFANDPYFAGDFSDDSFSYRPGDDENEGNSGSDSDAAYSLPEKFHERRRRIK